MSSSEQWFSVDKEGLAKLLSNTHPASIVWELLANAFDTDAKAVVVSLMPQPNRPTSFLIVEDDDPNGFADLAHAWTLFAESSRKGDAEKRGRFNLGEKLALARCVGAEIRTTTGCVVFDADGRHESRKRRVVGSEFSAVVRLTRAEHLDALDGVRLVIPPDGVEVTLNGTPLRQRTLLREFHASLPTVRVDEEGFLRPGLREALVTVHARDDEEPARLYEMGIPIAFLEGGEDVHLNVHQKVPLTMDRQAPLPSFLAALRVALLNSAPTEVVDPTAAWVRAAASDPRCAPESIAEVLRKRFGDRVVSADPSDPEGQNIAVEKGYVVVHGGSLSAGEWANAKAAHVILPAGQVTPSRPEKAEAAVIVPPSEWTPAMRAVADWAKHVSTKVNGKGINVSFVRNPPPCTTAASYGDWLLTFNLGVLGEDWCSRSPGPLRRDVLALIIHELAHERASNHLTHEYHDACCDVGAACSVLAASGKLYPADTTTRTARNGGLG